MKRYNKTRFFSRVLSSLLLSLLIFTGSSCGEYVEPVLQELLSETEQTALDIQKTLPDSANDTDSALTADTASEDSTEETAGTTDQSDELYTPEETSAESAGTAPESTDTQISASDKTEIIYYFRTKKLYEDHFKKHGAEFGDITKEEYLRLANELILSDSDRILHKTSDDGDSLYYDPDNNYFLVLSGDGYIRTLFRPDKGIEYWNRQ